MHSVQLSTQPALSLHFFCITDIYWTVSFNEVQGYLWSCLIKVTQKQAFFKILYEVWRSRADRCCGCKTEF